MTALPLGARFVAVLVATLLAVAAGSWALWQAEIDQRVQTLRDSRFLFSLGNARSGLESSLRLGLPAADLPGAQALIDQLREREPGILAIDVFAPDGRILFTTEREGGVTRVPSDWARQCLAAESGNWRITDDDDSIQCAPLVNAFEQRAGGVLLRYRLAEHRGIGSGLHRHWPELLLALTGLAVVAGAAGLLAGRPLEGRLRSMAGAVTGKARIVDDGLAGPLAAALARGQDMERQRREAEAEADLLDAAETLR